MSLTNRNSRLRARHNAAALLLGGAGLAGLAGCAFNVSPGERLAATAHEEAESKSQVKTSALSRLLKREPQESAAPETESATSSTTVRGRMFSAIVDRFPGRRRETTDPFLAEEIELERQRAEAAAADSEIADAEKPDASSRAVVRRPKVERSDAELWEIFESDASTSVAASPVDPTLATQPVASPALDRRSLQQRERANSFADREPHTRTAVATTNGPSSAAEAADANPFARFVSDQDTAATAAGPATTGADGAKQELHDLMATARQQEQRGALHQARQTALDAVAVAERERIQLENGDDPPADLVRRIEQRLEASTRDPFNDALAESEAAPAATFGTSPFSTGRSLAGALAATAPAQADAFESTPEFPTPTTPAPTFPKAPEWRGVQANSPVSLAVVEQTDRSAVTLDASPVRHADLDDAASPARATSRLLPRNLLSRNLTQKSADRPMAFANPVVAEGPLLAPPRDPAPAAIIAPTPPLMAEATVAAIVAPVTADEELERGRGYGGWVFGGVLLAAGLWLLGVRGRNPFARTAAARR